MTNDYSDSVTIIGDQSQYKETYYDIDGKETLERTEEAPAVKLDYGSRAVYRVAIDKKSRLFDPMRNKAESVDSLDGLKLPKYKMKEVNKRCFESYLSYLDSRHESVLNIAQREIL